MNYLISIIVFQAIFTFLLLVFQRNKDVFKKWLTFLLLLISVHFSVKLSFLVLLKNNAIYYNLPTSFSLVYGPIGYLATKSLVKKLSTKTILIHLSPFIITSGLFLFMLFRISLNHDYSFIDTYEALSISGVFSLITYSILTHLALKKQKNNIDATKFKFLKIYAWFCFGFVSLILIFLVLSLFGIYVNTRLVYLFLLATVMNILLFLIKTSQQPIAKSIPENLAKTSTDEQKYSTSNLSETDLVSYKSKIESFFKTQKPYLLPELTLQDLSKRLGIPKHHVTQVLNTGFNKNFYQFINEYRVREVIQKMSKSKQNETIIDIAYSCGFNSKSTFNTYFKKVTGSTPKSFKQTQI